MENTDNQIYFWLKNYVDNNYRGTEMHDFETFNELPIYDIETQIGKINKEIIRFSEMLDAGWPFLSYNFDEGIFKNNYYLESESNTLINMLSNTYNCKNIEECCNFLELNTFDLLQDETSELYRLIHNDILIVYSRCNILSSLVKKRKELQNPSLRDNSQQIKTTNYDLQWYGSQTDLIELTKALIVNGNLKGNQEVIFNTVQKTFNKQLNNIDQAITKFNSNSGESKFLKELANSLSEYISMKINKNR
ncbi:RteC domain-containing protein [Maribacter sp. ACAM166]|uniref:RteC domain-containing protein n=1 Tax=Maribacter sp. ACAM166 TaxID=2508996 RepID=UPI0010FE328E|nr:RteC domain-containing protein [Maribacter sp. ACAM166]TLP80930.1 hypothetical protein ES765_05645 [Maribacter sp. ACAM166]